MPKPPADGSASARPKLPPIPREPYTLPDGPEVYIRALRLDERLALRRDLAALGPASSADDAVALMVPRLLGVAVVDGDGVPIFSGDDWCQYGASYPGTALELFNRACVLSHFAPDATATGDAAKNSPASRS